MNGPDAGNAGGAAPELALGGRLVSPWWPAAIVSLVLPGVGLMLLTDRDRKREAFGILGVYLVGHVVLSVLIAIFAGSVPVLAKLVWAAEVLFTVAIHAFALVYTHDEAARSYPPLGAPLVFRRPLPLP